MDTRELSCSNCKNRIHSLFSDLSLHELRVLSRSMQAHSFKKGQILFEEGERVNHYVCLNSGKVKMTRASGNGKVHIVGLKKTGEVLCFNAMISEQPSIATYEALEDSSVCMIPKRDFMQVLSSNNQFSMGIIKALSEDIRKNNCQMLSMTQKHMRARLAEALIKVRDVYGTDPATGYLNLDLKRSDLAGLSNMTVANAIRILSGLKSDNLVEVNRRQIRILNLHKLKAISQVNLRKNPVHKIQY